jgi:hypothetical protein
MESEVKTGGTHDVARTHFGYPETQAREPDSLLCQRGVPAGHLLIG